MFLASLGLKILLTVLITIPVAAAIVEGMAMVANEVPSFTVQELLSNQRSEEFATILRSTGLMTIEMPSINDAFRHAALDGLCRCETKLAMVENSDTALLNDGITVRTTVASATVGNTPRPLPANLAEHCGLDTMTSMEHVRDEVAVAANAFVRALDRLIVGNNGRNDEDLSLLRDSKGRSYDRVASIVNAANHLEHFHLYSKNSVTAKNDKASLDWHTDAGLFLAFIPALACHGSMTESADASFWYQDENGISTRAIFQPNSIAIMLGVGAEHWLHSPVQLKATRHAVVMQEGDQRAWYGMMYLVPETAVIQEYPPATFRDMKASMTLSSKRVYGQASHSVDSISIGCGTASAVSSLKMSNQPFTAEASRRRLEMVGSPSDCNNSTNFFCWMSCLDIPNADRAEDYVTSGYSLYCLDPSVLSSSVPNTLAEAVAECPYGVHNAKCVGSWQFTVPGVPSTPVLYNATNSDGAEPFCYGGTSMYMDGFHWMDTVCVIYLFPEWILNTKGKFVAASIGSLFVGIFLEVVIMRRRRVMSSMGAGYGRLAASAIFYGLQLTVGYFGMLVVMTYSGPLFMCIILGIVGGHILFNAKDAIFAVVESPVKAVSCCSGDPSNTVEEQPCAGKHSSSVSTTYGSLSDGGDATNGVPEGSTPCCQHTL